MVQQQEQRYQLHDNNYESSDEESGGNNEDDESEDEYDDDEGGEESLEDDEDEEDDDDAASEDDDGDDESGASSDDNSQEPEEQFENEGMTGNVQRLVQRYESTTENSRNIDEPDDSEDGDEEEIHFVPDEVHEDASDSEEEEEPEGEDEDEEEEDDEVEDDKDDDEEKKLFLDEPQYGDDDEPRDAQREERLRRKIVIAAIVCCCLVIIAVVLGVILATKEDDAKDLVPSPTTIPTPEPTSKPTPTPVAVTSSPSAAPSSILDEIFFPVIADTYLRGGDFANTTFGTDDILQVRTSGNNSDESYILMEFDLTRLPEVNNSFQESQILLQLTHVESLSEEIDSITVIKLPYDASVDVENITWGDFNPVNRVVGPSFTVGGDAETVLVDITSLIQGGDGSVSPLRGGRRLQEARKILLLLESAEGSNLFGEVFRSRESGAETAPLIIHNIITESPSLAPSVSSKPSFAPSKSTGPTLSSTPTSSRPPSASPSISEAPSTSLVSTNNTVTPTSINASETFAPSRVDTMSNNNSLSPGGAVPSLAPSRP